MGKLGIWLGVMGGVLGLGAAVFGIVMATRISTNHINGTITSQGGELGTWSIQPDNCESGEVDQFRGVKLFAGSGNTHGTVFLSPVGGEQKITINLGNGKARVFDQDDCKVLDGDIHRENSRVNRIYNISGRVRFDCAFKDEHVTGDVTFENCH